MPLKHAAVAGDVELIGDLLEAGANACIALNPAVRGGHEQTVRVRTSRQQSSSQLRIQRQ